MLTVRKLRMDDLDQPLGVEAVPRFSWAAESDRRNVRQKAYRLQIAKDRDFSDLLFDSGRVESDESAYVQADCGKTEPCTWYFVRVRVDDGTETSPWSGAASFLTGMTAGWKAGFITAEEDGDGFNSHGTYLRRSWQVKKPVRSAVVCATALGIYHLRLNGQEVGDRERMLPGWTSYRDHLCYQTWDVTDLVRPGENVLGAHVGAGWFKGMMCFVHERCIYGDRTALLAQLTLRYTDGSEETVCTDGEWWGCASPVTFSEIYDGERVDARLDQPGWDIPGFAMVRGEPETVGSTEKYRPPETLLSREQKEKDRAAAQAWQPEDTLWRPVKPVDFPLHVLEAQPGCQPMVHEEIPVKEVLTTPKGETVLDFGQNLTGYVRFRVKGKRGELAHLRCFETLDAEGNAYFDNLRGVLAEIRYICGGDGEQVWDEQFSFQGFRYALVAAWPGPVRPEDFTACAVYSDMPETGAFACSHPLLNQLQHNIGWSLRGNFLDIPTDCPQRDERMGWTGDAQIFCGTAAFLRGCKPFFTKWLRDIAVDQTGEGGIPHMVPDIFRYRESSDWLVSQGTHSAAGWGDVAVILPWMLYRAYGDRSILEKQFESMKRWIDFMRGHAEDYLWSFRLQFGDWVALDAEEGSYFGATPLELTNTAYFAYVTELFTKACRVLNRLDLAEEYGALRKGIADKFRRMFLDDSGVMKVQTQTAHILGLVFRLIPPEGIHGTVEGLCRLLEKENGHLVTGFMGTPAFCFALSENGRTREAYDLLLQEDFPSWLYQVKKGATTIWEHWDGLKPDGTMWSPDMNSFNHYAYGAVGEWMYRVVAGIGSDEDRPGYRRIRFAPQTDHRLSWVEARLETGYGTVASRWEREGNDVCLSVEVPVNCDAEILLEEGAKAAESDLLFASGPDGRLRASVGSGTWKVQYHLYRERGTVE